MVSSRDGLRPLNYDRTASLLICLISIAFSEFEDYSILQDLMVPDPLFLESWIPSVRMTFLLLTTLPPNRYRCLDEEAVKFIHQPNRSDIYIFFSVIDVKKNDTEYWRANFIELST